MATLDGIKGAATLLGYKTYRPGMCLEAVSKALGSYWLASDRPGWYTYALRAWQNTPTAKRKYDRTPPKGAVVYFSASSNGYGHIAISDGGGYIISTDIPSNGRVGRTTISALERAWGRTYLGWSAHFMGHTITTGSSSSGSSTASSSSSGLANGGHRVTDYPFGEYRLKKGDSEVYVCNLWGMSKTRFRNLNGKPSGWKKGQWPAGLIVRVAFDYAPQKQRLLRSGSQGYDVAHLQFHLNAVYPAYSKLKVDGIFGAATVAAIEEFQRRSGLAPDAIVGTATWRKLGTLRTR